MQRDRVGAALVRPGPDRDQVVPPLDWRRARPGVPEPDCPGQRRTEAGVCAAAAAAGMRGSAHRDGVPTLIGELGCPFDLHVGDHTTDSLENAQIAAMDTTLGAVERALLSCCIWNYSATNSDAHGDGWNGENFSIWTPGASEQHTVFAGGRALPAVIRPYAFRCPGTPVKMQFCIESKRFDFEYVADSDVDAELVVFLPRYHYHEKPDVVVSDGCYDVDMQAQTLRYRHSAAQRLHTLVVTPAAQRVLFQSKQHGGDEKNNVRCVYTRTDTAKYSGSKLGTAKNTFARFQKPQSCTGKGCQSP